MAGRKKGTEETMTTEEMMGTEAQALEGAEKMSDGDAAAEESNMDRNELLESMDQKPEEPGVQEGKPTGTVGFGMPELSEEEIFGEAAAETDGTGTEEVEAVPEIVSEVEAGDTELEKPKRTSRKKKGGDQAAEGQQEGDMPVETGDGNVSEDVSEETLAETSESMETGSETEGGERAVETVQDSQAETADISVRQTAAAAPRRPSKAGKTEAPVLTLESRGEVETEDAREEVIWHEIHNAYRTRKILTGQLGGIEQTDSGKTIVIVDYKGFRIVIPLKEMMINLVQGRSPSGKEYAELMLRQNKVLGNMLGAEIDFIVKGIDSKTRSVGASRREAMLKKRQIFYLDTDAEGMYRVYEGRIVQARVIAVAEKVIRVEIFGVECSIMARDLAWDWIGDAHERFSVGDQVLVRILSVRRDSLEDMGVKADVKSVTQDTQQENLKKCRVQSKYAGKVTDVHKGVVYIRLSNGVNAVAHACYDYRTPGKKDDVSFAVTKIDEERGVAVGIITRIIRQNL